MLVAVGSLSKLFSESAEPYLEYRIVENLFCKSFVADNLSRSDTSADALKEKTGFGIKTFLEGNGKTMQKVAEFNREHNLFNNLKTDQKILKIANLRNERLDTTKRIFALSELIYHCVTRKAGKIFVYETPVHLIDVGSIKDLKLNGNSILFKDNFNEYAFNIAKSTLYKRFITENIILDIHLFIHYTFTLFVLE